MRLRRQFVLALLIALAVTILVIVAEYWPHSKSRVFDLTRPSLAVDTPKAGLAAYEGSSVI